MTTVRVNGVLDLRPEPSELGQGLPAHVVTVRQGVRIGTARAGVSPLVIEGQPDDVVEIELQDGLRIWSRLDDVRRDLVPRSQRSAAADAVDLPSELTLGPASRSVTGWAIKALKVVNIDLEGEIAQFISQHVEGRLQPGPGLYLCAEDDAARLHPVHPFDSKGPTLVFLHGTASSTSGSFAGLWGPGGPMKGLFEYYGGRVLACQHRTLTASPIENALALVNDLGALLGENAELHIVSHSRGGLIGELLARGMRVGAAPITPDDLDIFESPGRDKDRRGLEQLSRTLQTTRLRVTRFVRVACPARGTTLADGRIDRYVSVLVNLASLVGLKGNPVYDGLTSLLAGVLKKRTDPRELPGLEAMMPTSPLVRMLNRPDIRTDADLHVLGGDLAGAGLFGRLKTLATDLYYRDDHDLVVNTPAMLGGIERTKPVPYWIDTGDQVTHFSYFARADTSRRLVAALTGSNADFRTLQVKPSAVTSSDYVKRGIISRPVVFVLPGIMGSQLTVDGRPVWMNIRELAHGGLSLLNPSTTSRAIEAQGLVADGYGDLCEHLAATHDVIPFPYDWRHSIDRAAAALRNKIDEVLPSAEAVNQPVRLLAHSMGGLVVRMMLADPDGQATWKRMCRHPDARFIMLGTPNAGSHAIAALLMGRDALVKKLALVDLRSSHGELLQTISAFEGVLDLLPQPTSGTLDLFDPTVWEILLDRDAPATRGLFGSSVATSKSAGFRWTPPDAAALTRARQIAATIRDSPLDPARVAYVAGVADETACDIVIDNGAEEGRRVRVMASAQGDGRVLWKTGIPKNVRTFYMDAVHGDLASDRRHFPAIVDLLKSGATTRLGVTPPVRREAEERFEMREQMPAMVPDEAELTSDALGGHRARVNTKPTQATIDIRVVHDNLDNARSPVLVSHYKNDVIVAAEAYLDRRLDGRLTELHRMELYPGALNTGVVVVNDTTHGDLSTHPGAIVAGLGMVGELTPGALTATLAHALTLYGADCVGRARRQRQREVGEFASGGPVSAPLTAVLVGSGDGGLSVSDSIRALLTAVQQANRRLRGPESVQSSHSSSSRLVAQIDQVDLFELYEDRAIEMVHLLRGLTGAPEFDSYQVQPLLARGAGGERRVRFDQAASWWQRISVKTGEMGALEFQAVTQTARASAQLLPLQHGQVDGFVRQAKGTTSYDPRLGRTLFELLVPHDFKAYAPDRQKLALMLDPETAALPWELLQDGFDRTAEPLSVASGMLRQLVVPDERQHVLRAPTNTALVIGNPKVSDARFPSLPGAAAEAASVAGVLMDSGHCDVMLLLEEAASPEAVLSAIHEKPWRILHLAAHGVFAFEPAGGKERISGLVLDEGLFFTAADANQMRYVPELVFINCCHLGNTAGDSSRYIPFHKLAANLATQFIKMGARAVIAAGWAVDDAAAKTFATSFYQLLLDGVLYGEAMLQARRNTYLRHGQTNTWGAYQCYGDPSFSLAAGKDMSRPQVFVSDSELRMWLDALVARARQQDADVAATVAELEQRVADTPATWWTGSSGLCAAAALAFFELGRFERAISFFERVVSAERSDAAIRTLEQFANCRVRWARTLALDVANTQQAMDLLGEAERQLRGLLALGETSERWSLLGGLMKRRAMLAGGADRRTALSQMSEAYGRAYDRSKADGTADTYPLGNQIAAAITLSWQSGNGRAPAITALLSEFEEAASRRIGQHTDTFNLSAGADRLLLQALADRRLDEQTRQGIQQKFVSALSRGASARVRDSIRGQFDFFRCIINTEFPEDGRGEMIENLNQLQELLPL